MFCGSNPIDDPEPSARMMMLRLPNTTRKALKAARATILSEPLAHTLVKLTEPVPVPDQLVASRRAHHLTVCPSDEVPQRRPKADRSSFPSGTLPDAAVVAAKLDEPPHSIRAWPVCSP